MPRADTRDVPGGRVSVTVTGARETDGPRLVTDTVHVNGCPATGCSGAAWVFVIARSAEASTDAPSVAELLPVLGSKTLALTVTPLVSTVPDGTVGATLTTTVMAGKEVPDVSVSLRRQTNGVAVSQVQPVPPAETSVVPAAACR